MVSPLRLEQLTLFDLEALSPPVPVTWPVHDAEPGRIGAPRRRRRRAWLPRLIRWIKGRAR
jgi:hypothetical protein